MRLVVDAGPLIALSKTGHLDLLSHLFDDIVIPAAVLAEIAPLGETCPGAEIRSQTWAAIRSVSTSARVQLQQSSDIAAGEAEAILIAYCNQRTSERHSRFFNANGIWIRERWTISLGC